MQTINKYQEDLLRQSRDLVIGNFSDGEVSWESPSNIAIVKYWGKKQNQIPTNPSISFSLDKSKTRTTIEYQNQDMNTGKPQIEFLFEGIENSSFQKRIEHFINSVTPYFPFLEKLNLTLHSENTFPHSAGIASSASSLSSIALGLCSIEDTLFKTLTKSKDFYKKASFISRLGSGSASRSVFPKWAMWGKNHSVDNSTDEYAVPLKNVNTVFSEINDTVLLVSSSKKTISSSKGHELMNDHVFASSRVKQANSNCVELNAVLKSGDVDRFIEIAENEALTLHALMMSSTPGYFLLQPNSILLIKKIRSFRKETKLPVTFTIDAGPNIHLLYFSKDKKLVDEFVHSELADYCENKQWIDDKIGQGPKQLN